MLTLTWKLHKRATTQRNTALPPEYPSQLHCIRYLWHPFGVGFALISKVKVGGVQTSP